jgi:hypothetical protein
MLFESRYWALRFASRYVIFTSEENMKAASITAPNQTRLKILAGVLRLERFTVADLCANAGLLPSQVYRELSSLQEAKILESKSTVPEGEKGPRHCPRKWYELRADAPVRAQLEAELTSFLPDYEDAQTNRHLKRAQEVLTALSTDTLSVSLRSLKDSDLNQWEGDTRKRFEEARAELKRASWESEIDFSQGEHSEHPIQATIRMGDTLENRFGEQLEKERNRRELRAARTSWAAILSSALRSVIPVARAAAPVRSFANVLAISADALMLSEKISLLVKGAIEKQSQLAPSVSSESLLPFWSSLELDLRAVQSDWELFAALAKHAITYGNSPDEPLAYIRKLFVESEKHNYRLLFDEANLAQLAARPSEAHEAWVRYSTNREPLSVARDIEAPVVARILANRWSPEAFEKATSAITMKCDAAVIAISETPFQHGKEYVIEPQLYNPLPDKSGRVFISIGDPLVENRRLYVKTTGAEQPVVLGVASMAYADFFNSRVNQEDAWKLATTMKPGDRIIKVEFFRNATASAREEAENILTTNLFADLVG